MDDEVPVCVVDGLTDSLHEAQAVVDEQAPAIAVVIETLTLNEFHDKVRKSIVGRAAVNQAGDGWGVSGSPAPVVPAQSVGATALSPDGGGSP